MSKADVLKELYVMLQAKNYKNEACGIRAETLDIKYRSKAIRSFFVDLFDGNEDEECYTLLKMLEQSIDENVDIVESEN